MAIYFYKEFGPLGYLASYSPHGFYKDGIYWKTVEHYYQAQKFEEESVRQKIANALTPKEASSIGRDRIYKIRKDWRKIKKGVMYDAVYCKFKTHPDLAQKLLDTGDEEIIEETTKETYWGCGPNRDGENNYGKILCQVRERLLFNRKEMGNVLYYKERV